MSDELIFKEGNGWKVCFDPKRDLYTAKTGGGPNVDLYEINKEVFDHVDDPDIEYPTSYIYKNGRHLFMAVDDRCGPPYTVILDSDYEKLCPWASVSIYGKKWDEDMTDAVVEIFESEKDNREQRRKKRAERKKKEEEIKEE